MSADSVALVIGSCVGLGPTNAPVSTEPLHIYWRPFLCVNGQPVEVITHIVGPLVPHRTGSGRVATLKLSRSSGPRNELCTNCAQITSIHFIEVSCERKAGSPNYWKHWKPR